MYIVLGKISEERKDRAYRLFNYETQEVKLFIRDEIMKILDHKVEITGLQIGYNSYGKINIRKNFHFMWKEGIPELKGDGNVEKEDRQLKMIIGTNGYKTCKNYVLINPLGEITVYSEEEVKQRIKEGERIVGLKLSSANVVMTYIKKDLSDTWLERLGFIKEDGLWQRPATSTTESITENKPLEQ